MYTIMSREDPQLRIRLPSELKDKIEASAKANNRSMNAEIIFRINLSYLLDEDKSMFTTVAEPNSYVGHAERVLKSRVEESLPSFLELMAKKIMTDEFRDELKRKAREQAEKEWDEMHKKPT
ncbi:regulatory protein Mnt [Klebsiella pneumoniae]|nr:regulatory protein Mnt [Klebsiella pneumoniae]STV23033.1 regulatory protein Mnt [Klebsiella pneumoniae subsp. pneumoniae]VED54164.1 Arc-like DNA binding domain [Klebsiella aerogenes]SLY51892.1 regulatory protein Mnt [Klebsiella pneumoniae]SLY52620.1 regulatory protein Mnt [Klebsiella pneumoniae]